MWKLRSVRMLIGASVLALTSCDEIMPPKVAGPELVGFAELTFHGVGEPYMTATIRTTPTLATPFPNDLERADVVGALDVNGATQPRTRYVFASFDASALTALPVTVQRRRGAVTIAAAGRTLGGTAVTRVGDGAGGALEYTFALDIRPSALPAFDSDGKIVFRAGSLRSATGAEITALRHQAGPIHIFTPAFVADEVVSFAFALPLPTNASSTVAMFSVLLLIFEYQ